MLARWKDVVAVIRNAVNEIKNEISASIDEVKSLFVKKSGDTMTGNLNIKRTNPCINFYAENLDNRRLALGLQESTGRLVVYDAALNSNIIRENEDGSLLLAPALPIASGGTGRSSFSNNSILYTSSDPGIWCATRTSAGLIGWSSSGVPTQYAVPLTIANGGTGATTATAARTALSIPSLSVRSISISNQTLSAGTNTDLSIAYTLNTGETAIGVVGFNAATSYVAFKGAYLDTANNKAIVSVSNMSSTAKTGVTINVRVLISKFA